VPPRVFAHHDHNYVFATPYVIKPPREEASVRKPGAPSHLVWVCECLPKTVPIRRQQVGMALRYVPFAFGAQLNLAVQVRTVKAGHYSSSLNGPAQFERRMMSQIDSMAARVFASTPSIRPDATPACKLV
jgi:hypothetical protein